MTATRGIIASLVAVTLIGVGAFVWMQNRDSCPEPYSAGGKYTTGDEVSFTDQIWKAERAGTTQVPGPNATEWSLNGTC
ncbi:hypothetical protein [Kineosporia babensis]|uniref:Chitin-binding type-3 domain-containing protein n=1 Tax=Kineosporia babensis TaxID=499548 RepID=A0A9X1NM07_9ACTN|nr:hypothetical protein [Kineosporia babensis]MCD5315591.1 hypothetical protein [Kineosporia babensis]